MKNNIIYPKNFGLDMKKIVPADWQFGASSIVEKKVVPSGDWTLWIPIIEYQRYPKFDTMGCVSFSALNCLETMHKQKYGEEINRDDRYTVVSSGTTRKGNWLTIVGNSIRKEHGTLVQDRWAFDGKTWDDYYQPVSQELRKEGVEWLEYYKIQYEWANPPFPPQLIAALKTAPLQVAVHAWENPVNGIYQKVKDTTTNHVVMLFNYKEGEYWEIFDSYDKDIKQLAWDFYFGFAMKYDINKILEPIKFKDYMFQFIKIPKESTVYALNSLNSEIRSINSKEDYLALTGDKEWELVREVSEAELLQYIKVGRLYSFLR